MHWGDVAGRGKTIPQVVFQSERQVNVQLFLVHHALNSNIRSRKLCPAGKNTLKPWAMTGNETGALGCLTVIENLDLTNSWKMLLWQDAVSCLGAVSREGNITFFAFCK
jgi:hypothetical protein